MWEGGRWPEASRDPGPGAAGEWPGQAPLALATGPQPSREERPGLPRIRTAGGLRCPAQARPGKARGTRHKEGHCVPSPAPSPAPGVAPASEPARTERAKESPSPEQGLLLPTRDLFCLRWAGLFPGRGDVGHAQGTTWHRSKQPR